MIKQVQKAFETTKAAQEILTVAGAEILKSSLKTAKEMASLYQEAGQQMFSLGKEMAQKTVELTVENQKEMLKTSGQAVKEVAQRVRTGEAKAE